MDLVSVIITSYCGSKNIRRSILSVLNQTYSSIELIIVDDNDSLSEERKKTEAIVESIHDKRVKYIKHKKNMNGSSARNTGIVAAKGKYIQLLDDDDYLFPEKITYSLETLKKYSDCSMIITGVIAYGKLGIADLSGAIEESGDCKISKEWLLRFNALGTGSNIFATKESIEGIGGFDVSYPRMQDIEFIFRYCQKYKVCAIPIRLIIKDLNDRLVKVRTYRSHKEVMSKFIVQFESEIYRLLGTDSGDKWFKEQYAHLFRIALMNGSKEDVIVARNSLIKYRELTLAEKVKMRFPLVWRMLRENEFLRRQVLKVREGRTTRETLERKLSAYEKEQMDVYIEKFWTLQY